MIRPLLSGDEFLAAVRSSRDRPGVRLWWLGQSGFLVQAPGRHLLIDPYLSDSLTRKYANTNKPHVRMTALVIEPERLNFIDVVTSSHNHTDHLDADTLGALRRANPSLRFLIPEANRAFVAERLGCDPSWPVGADDGGCIEVCGFRFTGIAAAHESVDRDEHGRCKYLGYVVEIEGVRIYHSGDTVLYDGMVERLRPHAVDIALLPVNGSAPERGVPGNLNGIEAARLAHSIGARCAVPMHYEMFEFNTATPDEFAREAERIGQRVRILRAGECMEIV